MTNEQYREDQRKTKKEVYTDLLDEIKERRLRKISEVISLIERYKKELSDPTKTH